MSDAFEWPESGLVEMHLIVYTSEFAGTDSELESTVEAIVAKARISNQANGITGVFFNCGRRFLQFIEGEFDAVNALMAKLSADPRHRNVSILFNESVPERGISRWSMDKFNVGTSATLDLEYLQMVRDACRANFQTRTETIVSIFKGFIESDELD